MYKPIKTVITTAALITGSFLNTSAADLSIDTSALQSSEGETTWDKSITLRSGVGYKDNVLLNKSNRQKSGFWLNSGDFFVLREQEHGNHLSFFGSFEDRRYFSAEGINKEQIGTSQLDVKHDIGDKWQVGVMLQYVYLDQVIDVSITENLNQAIPVKAHSLGGAPYVVRNLPWDMRVELRFDMERQFVKEPLDDFWEGGPRVTLYKKYGHRSEAFLSYSFRERAYDNRRQIDFDFSSVPDTSLRFQKHIVETGTKHYWDEARRWRTTVKGSYERNLDNGSGMYDFNKYKATIQGAYVRDNWEARLQGRVTQYDFDRQPVDFDNPTSLARTEWSASAQIRRNIYRKLSAFVESDHEWVESNFTIESYHANTVMGGLEFEF